MKESIKIQTDSRSVDRAGRNARRVLPLLAFALVVLPILAACGTPEAGKGQGNQKVTLGFILPDLQNPIFVPMRTGAQDAAKKYGFELKLVGPQPPGVQGQISLIQDLVQQKVNGIILVPSDATGLNKAIDDAITAGVPVATANLDAPESKRAFYYGPNALQEGQLQGQKVLDMLKKQGATGNVAYLITSCLPSVTGQLDRRKGFETTVNKQSGTFTMKEVGFFDTSTDPAKNLSNIQNIYTSQSKVDVIYAMCAPDTQNWGKVLKDNNNKKVLLAGHDWLPGTLDLIDEGWVPWSLGESPYDMGFSPLEKMYEYAANGKELPTGVIFAKSMFADKSNMQEIRKSPDAQGN